MGRIRNLDKLQKRLRSIGSAKAAKEVEGALFAGADLVAAEAGLSITRGAVSGKNHVASAPGQPPNADSGVLDKGIGVYPVPRKTADGIEVTIVSMARYSEALEFGSSKMSARPFFRPARDKKRKAAKRLFDNAVKKILNGAAE